MLLLDWQLKFKSSSLRRKFEREYNESVVHTIRVMFIIIVIASIGLPFLEYLVTKHKLLDFKLYSCLMGLGVVSLFCFPLFFLDFIKIHSGAASGVVFGIYCAILNVANVAARDNYLYDYQSYIIAVFILLQPLLLRLQVRHFVVPSLLNVLFCVIVTIFLPKISHLARIASAFPNIASFVLAVFSGYFLEKRWKYDFFRRQVMASEALKLQWAMARDTSLLRNIFPKNLSDELELQMTRQMKRKRKTRKGVKGLITRVSTTIGNKSTRREELMRDNNNGPSGQLERKLTSSFKGKKNESLNGITRSRSSSLPSSQSPPLPHASPISFEVSDPHPSQDGGKVRKDLGPQVFFTPIIHSTRKVQNPMKVNSKSKFPSLSVAIPTFGNDNDDNDNNEKYNNEEDMIVEPFTPVISLPPVITTPTPVVPLPHNKDDDFPSSKLQRVLTTRGTALHPSHSVNNKTDMTSAEDQTYICQVASHTDGSKIALSHVYPDVYVIYAELLGFTRVVGGVAPTEMMSQLQRIFSAFDDIIDVANFEKIRCLGEGYLFVGNMSIPIAAGGAEAIKVASKMISELNSFAKVLSVDPNLSLRVGISFGSLIAGVTGLTKWNYDIFGKPYAEALALAESASPNTIAVSEAVYASCSEMEGFSFQLKYSVDGRKYFVLEEERMQKIPKLILNSTSSTTTDTFSSRTNTNETIALLSQPLKGVFFNKDFVGMAVEEPVDIITNSYHDGEVISARSKFKSNSDISLDDFRIDFGKNLGYTRGELDYEEKLLNHTKFNFRFVNDEFEKEFRRKAIKSAHNYTFILSAIFTAISAIFLLNELAYAPSISSIRLSVLLVYGIAAFVLLVYMLFIRFFDYTLVATILSAIPVAVYCACLVFVYYIDADERHLANVVVAILQVATFVRVPILVLFVVQLAFATTAAALTEVYHSDLPNSIQFILELFLFVIITFISQLRIHKSFRVQFIAQKRIKHDIYYQKIAQHRSKMLMRNIFPSEILPRLQPTSTTQGGDISGVVDYFEQATIMFVNLVNIEELTSELDPASKFQVYNDIISLFDEATHSFGLEKIKTINTVYMVASGLPKKMPNHVEMAIKLAIELHSIASKYTMPFIKKKFEVRIGIATGPVVAGIIGNRKYSYDCWSETVNTAMRMEASGWDGYLQASRFAFSFAKQKNLYQQRETLNARGKVVDTYMLQLSRFATN